MITNILRVAYLVCENIKKANITLRNSKYFIIRK